MKKIIRKGVIVLWSKEKKKNKTKILEELHFQKNKSQEAKITNDEVGAMIGACRILLPSGIWTI